MLEFDTKALVLGHLLGHLMYWSKMYTELPCTPGLQQNVTQLAWNRIHLVWVVDGIGTTNNSSLVLVRNLEH